MMPGDRMDLTYQDLVDLTRDMEEEGFTTAEEALRQTEIVSFQRSCYPEESAGAAIQALERVQPGKLSDKTTQALLRAAHGLLDRIIAETASQSGISRAQGKG